MDNAYPNNGALKTLVVKVSGEERKVDAKIGHVHDDPRISDTVDRRSKALAKKGKGMNTESFDPASTLVRPEMRIVIGPNRTTYGRKLKHDDVIVVPEFFCKEDDWSLYYQLVAEIREQQAAGADKSEWISWHEGAHLITNNPKGSKAYQQIQDKISAYFEIEHKSVGTRFNWYRDSKDWKPFHHDSAAFNPKRAKTQNITVGVSFGSTRELAFLHAKNGSKIYFPQTNGMLFSFGRDVNIAWKHGVNALTESEEDGRGRISIILWGLAPNVVEEANSPPLLTDNTRGLGHSIHRAKGNNDRSVREGRRSRSRDAQHCDVCRDWQRGHCPRGDNCRYLHRDQGGNPYRRWDDRDDRAYHDKGRYDVNRHRHHERDSDRERSYGRGYDDRGRDYYYDRR